MKQFVTTLDQKVDAMETFSKTYLWQWLLFIRYGSISISSEVNCHYLDTDGSHTLVSQLSVTAAMGASEDIHSTCPRDAI